MSESQDCLFCKIIAGEIPADNIYSDDDIIGFRDINPQAPVHVLFIPRRHIATANALEAGDAPLVGKLVLAARSYAAEQGFADNGYRLIMNCNADGGQTVFHLHLHLLAGQAMPAGFGVRG